MEQYRQENGQKWAVQVPICDRVVATELSADISLPDYQPEIKRLLRVRTTVLPTDKYVGAGSAEISGTVEYRILYTGNDGGLYCAAHTEEYRFTLPLEIPADLELAEGILCDAVTQAETPSVRASAPRRIALRSRLRTRVRTYGLRIPAETLVGEAHGAAERLMGQAECGRLFFGGGEARDLADEILVESEGRDWRVVSAEGQVFVSEATAGSGSVLCRGEVCLQLLCISESDGGSQVLSRRIPFSEEVPTDGVEVNCACRADGVCSDLRVTVGEGKILCEVGLRLRTVAQRNETVHYTRDLYLVESGCEVRRREMSVPRALRCLNGNFSLNTVLEGETVHANAGDRILETVATASASRLEKDRGRLLLTGVCRCQVLLEGEREARVEEAEIPFRYAMEGLSEGETVSDWDASVEVISCRARADGERMSLDAELAVSLSAFGQTEICSVCEVQVGEPLVGKTAAYCICYPSRTDSLWSVAKRYHRPIEALCLANDLGGTHAADSPDSLAEKTYLLL